MNVNKWTKGADGQTPHNLSQPRPRKERGYKTKQMNEEIHRQQHHGSDINYGEHGRNRRCVWKIATKSFKEAHFATFPETLIEPIIKAGCPRYICKKCGLARVEIYENNHHKNSKYIDSNESQEKQIGLRERWETTRKKIGYTDCGCNAGFEPGVILDLFMGAGTTGVEAKKQGKRYLGIEIKKEYINMSNKRINKIPETLF